MPDKFFLDTNVLVSTFDSKSPEKQAVASKLVLTALDGSGSVSWQVVQEFCNVAIRTFEPKMDSHSLGRYLDDVLFPLCRFFPDRELFKEALTVSDQTKYSWYDCLILASALRLGCRILYSEDFQDAEVIRSLQIINPFRK